MIADIKSALSESNSKSTFTANIQSKPKQPERVPVTQVTSQIVESLKSPVRKDHRSPTRGLRQSPTPRQRIQLEKTNSKNRFEVLGDEESMECVDSPSIPTPSTSRNTGQKSPQTPKPQRSKHK